MPSVPHRCKAKTSFQKFEIFWKLQNKSSEFTSIAKGICKTSVLLVSLNKKAQNLIFGLFWEKYAIRCKSKVALMRALLCLDQACAEPLPSWHRLTHPRSRLAGLLSVWPTRPPGQSSTGYPPHPSSCWTGHTSYYALTPNRLPFNTLFRPQKPLKPLTYCFHITTSYFFHRNQGAFTK